VLFIVVEGLLDGDDTRVLIALVVLASALLVPIQDLYSQLSKMPHRHNNLSTYTADKWRDQSDTSLSTSNSLAKAEEESQVAVNLIIALKFTGSLDTLPSRRDLDQNTLLGDADGIVKRDELLGLSLGGFLVKGETGIDFGRDTARNDSKNFFAKLDELRENSQYGLDHRCLCRR
jgi:hypothetical protein